LAKFNFELLDKLYVVADEAGESTFPPLSNAISYWMLGLDGYGGYDAQDSGAECGTSRPG
jgi:hypothetical protein